MPKRTDSRERLLRTAAELFRTQGFHATGLNQIVAESGAPKGSLYFHFPEGKQQLAGEAIALGAGETEALLREVLDSAGSPRDVVTTVVRYFADTLENSGFRSACPVAAVALEDTSESSTVNAACEQGYRSWLSLLTDYLRGTGMSAHRAADLATVAVASIEGGLLLAKTAADTACLTTIGDHVSATIEKELP